LNVALGADLQKVGGSMGGNWSNLQSQTNSKSVFSFKKLGGKVTVEEDEPWRESLFTEYPQYFPAKLMPISSLLQEPQKSNFDKAIKQYLKQSKPKFVDTENFGGGGGTPFDDYKSIQPARIAKLVVHHNENTIAGLDISYQGADNSPFQISHGKSSKNSTPIDLGKDDYFTRVDVWLGKHGLGHGTMVICGLKFQTTKTSHQLGTIQGEMHSIKGPDSSYRIVAFKGAAGSVIDSLGAHVTLD